MKRSFSLNNLDTVIRNVFTQYPPPSYGELKNDNKYSSKSMRLFFIRRFYKHIKK